MDNQQRPETLRERAARIAHAVLIRHHGNKRQACRELDISYHTLNGYLRVFERLPELPPPDPAREQAVQARLTELVEQVVRRTLANLSTQVVRRTLANLSTLMEEELNDHVRPQAQAQDHDLPAAGRADVGAQSSEA